MRGLLKGIINKIRHRGQDYIAEYKVSDFAHIGRNCRIGSNCVLVPQNMYLDDYVIIQNRNNFISYNGKIVIKKYSVVSSSCIIVPSNHRLSIGVPFYLHALSHVGDEDHTIVINEDVWIGAGCKLLPKSSFGRGCVVGAGSVVTKKIPPYAVVTGVPARIVAVRFSKEGILKHEEILYPPYERLTQDELDDLFKKYYCDKKVIPSYVYTNPEKEKLLKVIEQTNLKIQL